MPQQPWVDREAWQAVYSRLPPEVMQQVREAFSKLDSDGNGEVSKGELYADMKGVSANEFDDYWSILDVDRSGTLDMSEVALLVYMRSLNPFSLLGCDGCQKRMLFDDVVYMDRSSRLQLKAQLTTWESNGKQGPAPSDEKCVILCKGCFHTTPNHSPALHGMSKGALFEVVNTPSLDWRKWPFMADDWGHWTQCKVCGTSHNADATSYLGASSHMRPHPEGGFVCEFCSTVMCRKCAKALDATPYANPGVWTCRKDLKCANSNHNPSSYRNDGSTWFYDTEIITSRARDDRRTHCYTCHKNLILNRHPVFPDTSAAPGTLASVAIMAYNVFKVASALVSIGRLIFGQ